MKNIFPLFVLIVLTFNSNAQTNKLNAVQVAISKLSAAMISADSIALDEITSSHLSYGHSGGHVEGKTEFIQKIVSGKSDFVTIDISDQTIDIVGKSAIVRHTLNATTNDNGKPGLVKLKVLLIFQKEKGVWKMIARQAVKA